MKRRPHTPEQIVHLLAKGEKLIGEGQTIAVVAGHLEDHRVDLAPVAEPARREEGQRPEAPEGGGLTP